MKRILLFTCQVLISMCGINNVLAQLTWVTSGAAIGDTSVYVYYHKNDWPGNTLLHNSNNDDSVQVSNVVLTGATNDTIGVHIYRVHLAYNITSVTNNGGRAQFNHSSPRDLFIVGDTLKLSGFSSYNGQTDTVFSIVSNTAFVMDIPYSADETGLAERLGMPNSTAGLTGLNGNDRYFGVFKTDSVNYDLTYYYAGNPYVNGGNEGNLALAERDNNADPTWANSNANLDIVNDTLVLSGQSKYITEYILDSVSVLPIQLLYFDATLQTDKTVLCEWETATEINNDYFTIEKTTDGVTFELVAEVDGAGNSSDPLHYDTPDKNPYQGTSYYRLKQTDFNGDYAYSDLKPINLQGIDVINLSPNPAVDNIEVLLYSSNETKVDVNLYNMLGQSIKVVNQVTVAEGSNKLQLDVSLLSEGYYTLEVSTESGLYRSQKKLVIK